MYVLERGIRTKYIARELNWFQKLLYRVRGYKVSKL